MKKISIVPLSCIAMMLPLSLWAADDQNATEIGSQTRTWIEFQRSGEAESTTKRPMSGDVANRTYQRYVDTHSYRIPKSFADEKQDFVQD